MEGLELHISDPGLTMHVPLFIFNHCVDYVLGLSNELFVVINYLYSNQVGLNLCGKTLLTDELISVHLSRLFRLLDKADYGRQNHDLDGLFVLHRVPQVGGFL